MTKYFHLSIITSCHKSLIHECVTGQRRVTEMNVEQVRREGNERRKKKKITWNWLRNRNTIEFLGIWEQLNNPDFKPVEFDGIRMQTGLNSFTPTPKQSIEKTGAIGNMRDYTGIERLKRLNEIAIRQMKTLTTSNTRALEDGK